MMDKYYHGLLSPLWDAAGVIYELVYGHRHAAVIALSSLQQGRLQLAASQGLEALLRSLWWGCNGVLLQHSTLAPWAQESRPGL